MHFNNKITEGKYQLIPRALAFIYKEDEILFIHKKNKNSFGYGKINGVGGHIEQGEDIYTAARRELLEETGLEADQLRLVGTVTVDTGGTTGIGLYVILGTSEKGEPRPSEEGELEWVPFNKIHEKPLVEDLPILLPKALSQNSSDPPFASRYYYDQRDNLVIEFSD
jgi:8-oxo-dGTP diphosphatase